MLVAMGQRRRGSGVIVLRPTKKLAKRIGLIVGAGAVAPAHPCCDWCVMDFQAGRYRWLLFVHTGSLMGCALPARGATDARTLFAKFTLVVVQQLADAGLMQMWHERIEPHLGAMSFAPVPSMSCQGNVNDLARLAKLHLYDGASVAEVNRHIRDVPMITAGISSPLDKFTELARTR